MNVSAYRASHSRIDFALLLRITEFHTFTRRPFRIFVELDGLYTHDERQVQVMARDVHLSTRRRQLKGLQTLFPPMANRHFQTWDRHGVRRVDLQRIFQSRRALTIRVRAGSVRPGYSPNSFATLVPLEYERKKSTTGCGSERSQHGAPSGYLEQCTYLVDVALFGMLTVHEESLLQRSGLLIPRFAFLDELG